MQTDANPTEKKSLSLKIGQFSKEDNDRLNEKTIALVRNILEAAIKHSEGKPLLTMFNALLTLMRTESTMNEAVGQTIVEIIEKFYAKSVEERSKF